jgi:hypothetical protein
MKAIDLINRHWKNFTIIILLVFLFILFRQCKGSNDQTKLLQEQLAANKKERAQVDRSLDSIFKKHKADSATWAGEKQLAAIETKEADIKVSQQQKTIDRLADIVRRSTNISNNSTNSVLVSPEYKNACDSLPAEIDKLNIALAEKDTAIKEWTNILSYEVQERDSTIGALRFEINKAKRLYDGLEQIAETAIARGKPRGRLLGGISVLGNEKQFLSGAGVILAYQSKGGKQYQLSPKFIKVPGGTAEAFYEAGVLMTIFK